MQEWMQRRHVDLEAAVARGYLQEVARVSRLISCSGVDQSTVGRINGVLIQFSSSRLRGSWGLRGVRVGEASHPGRRCRGRFAVRSTAVMRDWLSTFATHHPTPKRLRLMQSQAHAMVAVKDFVCCGALSFHRAKLKLCPSHIPNRFEPDNPVLPPPALWEHHSLWLTRQHHRYFFHQWVRVHDPSGFPQTGFVGVSLTLRVFPKERPPSVSMALMWSCQSLKLQF